MDIFGIGTSIRSFCEIYSQTARRTGKTTQMIHMVNSGDRICFLSRAEADRVSKLCKEQGKNVICLTVQLDKLHQILRGARPIEGRTIFDHSLVEELYIRAIDRCGKDITQLESELSNKLANQKQIQWDARNHD